MANRGRRPSRLPPLRCERNSETGRQVTGGLPTDQIMESRKWTPFIGACILTGAIVLPHASIPALVLGIALAALVTAARTP